MGRLSTDKWRKPLTPKMAIWVDDLLIKLQDVDLGSLTIDDIAQKSNISKSTIYDYFPTKESILYTALNRRISKLRQFPSFNDDSDILSTYAEIMDWLCDNLDDITFSFMSQLEGNFPSCWKLFEEFTDTILGVMERILIAGIDKGIFKKVPVKLLIDLDKYFALEWLTSNKDQEQTLDELVKVYSDIRFNGILNNLND